MSPVSLPTKCDKCSQRNSIYSVILCLSCSGFQRAKLCLKVEDYEGVIGACTEEIESSGEHSNEAKVLRGSDELPTYLSMRIAYVFSIFCDQAKISFTYMRDVFFVVEAAFFLTFICFFVWLSHRYFFHLEQTARASFSGLGICD